MVPFESRSLLQIPRYALGRRMCNMNWFPLLDLRLSEGTSRSEISVATGRILMRNFAQDNVPCQASKLNH